MSKPWYQKTFLWGQINLTENDPKECDLDFWRNYWKKSGVEGVIINCGGIVSYYWSRFPYQYRAQGLGETDYFAAWNQAARKAHLAVIARMDISCTTKEIYDQHPDWYCKDQEGKPVLSQGRYVACVNGGYYHEFIPEVFREIIERYHPDGFADNSWAGPGMQTICYCENCRLRFREALGYELPLKPDWEDSVYRKWVQWSFGLRVSNWKFFNEITTRYGGRDCKWFGMVNADPFSTGGRFYDMRKLLSDAPFIFCDHQSRDREEGFECNSRNGALLRMISGENVISAESMAHYYKGERTFRLCAASRQEVRKWMLAGMSGGIAPWFHFVGGGTRDRRKFEISQDLFRWMKDNRQYLENRVNLARVGVVWNQETAIYYGREDPKGRGSGGFRGMTQSLSRVGIPYLPIHADDIGKYQDRLELLILPGVAILRETQERAVIQWLRQGKDLIVTGETALYDQEGEWKGAGPLYEELEVKVEAALEGVTAEDEDNWMVSDTHNYIEIVQPAHPVFQKVLDTDLLPFGGRIRRTLSQGFLKSIGTYVPPFPIYPPEFSWIREWTDLASIYAGTTKKGARVVYLPADVDRCYAAFHIPDHKRLLEGAVLWAGKRALFVRVSAPGHVQCDVYRQTKRILINLVNLAGCAVSLGTLEENLPIGPVSVHLEASLVGKGARGLVSGENWEIEREETGAVIRISWLEEHELIVVEEKQENGKILVSEPAQNSSDRASGEGHRRI